MKKDYLFITLMVFLLGIQISQGQTRERKWGIGLYAGKTEYNGDLGSDVFKFEKAFYGFGGVSFNHYLNPSFDAGLYGKFGDYGYYQGATGVRFRGEKTHFDLLLRYKFNNGYLLCEDSKLGPFITAGIGSASYTGEVNRMNTEGTDWIFPVGGGLKYQVNDWFALQYMITYNFTNADNHDFTTSTSANERFLDHHLGVVFSFGAPPDSDQDGVPDKLDACAGTPAGIKVDEKGCPLDGDLDGIPDYIDQCPAVAGVQAFAGCPDRDRDGIQDSEDACPDKAGIAQFKGCPDTDKDGIQDSEDACPTLAGVPELKGCPDRDRDGITDTEDRCPDIKGLASLKGCPDGDGDGIADLDDKCPDQAGIAANKGCPEVKEETRKVFAQALTGIQFESGKDIIKPVSFPILDNVVKVMKDNPSYNLEINGHTDSQGDDQKNLTLSQKRSEAVMNYLTSKGVEAGRLTPRGYGETIPVDDNNTPAGRAKNRRVEFKVVF